MIWKTIHLTTLLLLAGYGLLWLTNFFLGSSTQCGDGFGANWEFFAAVEMGLFIGLYAAACWSPAGAYRKTVTAAGCTLLAVYVGLFFAVTLLGYQHCGGGELRAGFAHGVDRLWPVFFVIFHTGVLVLITTIIGRRPVQ